MKDPRILKLAESLINYAVELNPGDKILIEVTGEASPLVQALLSEAYRAQGVPFLEINNPTLTRELLKSASQEQLSAMGRWDRARMSEMQAYIGLRAGDNVNEWADLPSEKLRLYSEYYAKPVHMEERVKNTRWCVLRYPNKSMAQLAQMSTESFEDFYFRVCNLDYAALSKAMDP